jgi:putative Mn2+ efflux pump MntP
MQNKESRKSTLSALTLIFVIMLMDVIGPLWAGAVYDHVMVGAPYWMGAIILVLAGLMILRPTVKVSQVA